MSLSKQMPAKVAPHLTALRQNIESMLDRAKSEYSHGVTLYNLGKCSPLRLGYIEGKVEGLRKAWEEAVHAETYAKGSDCQIDLQNPPALGSVSDK